MMWDWLVRSLEIRENAVQGMGEIPIDEEFWDFLRWLNLRGANDSYDCMCRTDE